MESMIPGAAGRIARAAGLIGRENEAMTAEAERLLDPENRTKNNRPGRKKGRTHD